MIYVNTRFLTQNITGSQRFAIEISKQLKKLEPSIEFLAPRNMIHKDIAKELEVKTIGKRAGHFWEQLDLSVYLKSKNYPLLLNLVNTAPLFYNNKIVTIHDISWKHFPYAVSRKFYLWYSFLIPKIAENSKHIFTVSEFSKKDISENLHINPNKFTVIYNAVNDNFRPLNINREKIILSVASIQKYKNTKRLIESFLNVRKKFPDFKLFLTGGENSKVFQKMHFHEEQLREKNIFFTGYLSEDKLVEMYNKAALFVFPSLFEGFGIPPLEAMACGCIVVASNAASIPEVCKDAALYFNPYSTEDMVKKIEMVLNNTNLQQKLAEKGLKRAGEFSWVGSAEKILEIIDGFK